MMIICECGVFLIFEPPRTFRNKSHDLIVNCPECGQVSRGVYCKRLKNKKEAEK